MSILKEQRYFCKRIKFLRETRNLTHIELAKKIGKTREWLCKPEKETKRGIYLFSNPNLSTILLLAETLEVHPSTLFVNSPFLDTSSTDSDKELKKLIDRYLFAKKQLQQIVDDM